MAGANSYIQMTSLDFNELKASLVNFMRSQNEFKDYNFEGSSLSTLMDLLTYNTQYNAYYLNMVANEMFLDSATQRKSVVSLAKLLNYTPKSSIAPEATVNVIFNNVSESSLTMPKFTPFLSEAIDGVNYSFVSYDSHTVATSNSTAIFSNVAIKQGTVASYSFPVDLASNPNLLFEIPDDTIDITTLRVIVQQSSSNTQIQTYDRATSSLLLDSDSTVYFLQEGYNGRYEIYFGDGVLGKQLVDGNIVIVDYITTEGVSATGANSFVMMDSISGYSPSFVNSVTPASNGSDRETIDSIKFQAPKSYSAQNRAVTKEDYITAIQQNDLGYAIDAVNVWGGEQNDPPVYGQVFVAIKPSSGYTLTDTQKQRLITDVIKPISVVTVTPTIVDPDYNYLKVTCSVLYDPKKTVRTAQQIQTLVKSTVLTFANDTLDSFNSTFVQSDLINRIKLADSSIITSDISLQIQKKFFPNLSTPTTYELIYGTELRRGMFQSGIYSYPSVSYRNPENLASTINNIYLEEVPTSTGGIASIVVTNPGYSYQSAPTVKILGDGTGATATATLGTNGAVKSIQVTNAGSGYTSAIVTITPVENDTTGQLAAATPILEGQYGTLRSYYNDNNNVKTIFNANLGTIDYVNGVVTINSFNPISVNDPLGQLTLSANPMSSIISSTYNRIITVDAFDPQSVIVNVTAKS